jgi:hypothetical protein
MKQELELTLCEEKDVYVLLASRDGVDDLRTLRIHEAKSHAPPLMPFPTSFKQV